MTHTRRGHATLENIAPLRCPIFLRASLSLPSQPSFLPHDGQPFHPWRFAIWQREGERGFIRDWKYPRAYGMHYRSSRFGLRLKKEGGGCKNSPRLEKAIAFILDGRAYVYFKRIYIYFIKNRNTFFMCKLIRKWCLRWF